MAGAKICAQKSRAATLFRRLEKAKSLNRQRFIASKRDRVPKPDQATVSLGEIADFARCCAIAWARMLTAGRERQSTERLGLDL